MQVDDFILLMTVSTSCSVTLEKWLRDLEDPGIGSGRVVGVSQGPGGPKEKGVDSCDFNPKRVNEVIALFHIGI